MELCQIEKKTELCFLSLGYQKLNAYEANRIVKNRRSIVKKNSAELESLNGMLAKV
jgi:hypothetical protein